MEGLSAVILALRFLNSIMSDVQPQCQLRLEGMGWLVYHCLLHLEETKTVFTARAERSSAFSKWSAIVGHGAASATVTNRRMRHMLFRIGEAAVLHKTTTCIICRAQFSGIYTLLC
uniref:Secreted protein n=1 Tax=Globodera pallida TaxID=36090 RepID=A0A183CQ76_GLOPA